MVENEKQEKALTVRQWLYKASTVKMLEAALPSFMNGQRFLRVFFSAMMINENLQDCTQQSILSSMIQCAQLGLEPILGKAALIPYKNKGNLEVQFQPMYRGLIDLARRTGEIKVVGHGVYEKDEFDVTYGTDEKVHHRPFLKGDRGELTGAYTVWTFQESGMITMKYMRREDIEFIRDTYSRSWKISGKDSVWGKHPREMFIKTVIKNHSKLQPCSIEMAHAVALDDKVQIGDRTQGLFMPGSEDKFLGIPQAPPTTVGDFGLNKDDPDAHGRARGSSTAKKEPLKDAMEASREKESVWVQSIVKPSGLNEETVQQFVNDYCKEHGVDPSVITQGALDDPQGFLTALKDWASSRAATPPKGEPDNKGKVDPDYNPELAKEYKGLRTSKEPDKGIEAYVFRNRDRIEKFPKKNFLELKIKFVRLTGKTWPFGDGNGQGEQPQEPPGGPGGEKAGHGSGEPGGGETKEPTEEEYLDEFASRLLDKSQEIKTDNPRMNNEEFEAYLKEQAEKRNTGVGDLKVWVMKYKRFQACWDGFLKRIGMLTNGEEQGS
jgi:recombination protein RecT